MNHVSFEEKTHIYRNVATGKRYISMTQLLQLYERGFDGTFWSLYKSLQVKLGFPLDDIGKKQMSSLAKQHRIDWNNVNMEWLFKFIHNLGFTVPSLMPRALDFLDEWEAKRAKASQEGNDYHDNKEQNAYKDGYMVIGGSKTNTNTSYSFDLSQLPDGGYRELLVYNHEYEVSGKADMVLIETRPTIQPNGSIKQVGYVKIDDDKTNAKLTFDGYGSYKYPINHIKECKHNKHALQLSGYMFLLEAVGFQHEALTYTHALRDDNKVLNGETQQYRIPYLRNEILSILKDYKLHYNNVAA